MKRGEERRGGSDKNQRTCLPKKQTLFVPISGTKEGTRKTQNGLRICGSDRFRAAQSWGGVRKKNKCRRLRSFINVFLRVLFSLKVRQKMSFDSSES